MLDSLLGQVLWSVAMALAGAGAAAVVFRKRAAAEVAIQRLAEARLAEREAQLTSLFEHVPADIAVFDRNHRAVMVNHSTSKAYDRESIDFVGTHPSEFREYWPEFDRVMATGVSVFQTGESKRFRTSYNPPGKSKTVQFDGIFFPIRDAVGRVDQVGLFLLDVTTQRQAEVRLAEREAQLTSLFEHVPAYITVFDKDLRVAMANQRAAEAYGREDLDNLSAAELKQHWPQYEVLAQAALSVIEKGSSERLRLTLNPSGGGAPIDVEGIGFPIRSKSGEIEQVGLFMLDVTEQRKAQTELAEQQQNLLAFFDYAPLQVYVTDLDHKIVMVNDWVFRETGATVFHPSNVIGLSADKMVPTQWAEMSHGNDATVVGRAGVTQVEVRGQFGGKERDIISIRFPIKTAEGDVVRIGGFVVDVTKQKEAERALQDRLAQSHQSEKLAALGQLLAGVAHELNNPLTVVVGRSAILAEKLAGSPHERAIQGLREAADRCNRIVKTFLAMARQSAPRRGAVALAAVVEAAVDITAYGMRSAGIRIDLALDPALPKVEADEDQLVQVITNLLLNAQHALEAHEGERTIRLFASTSHGRVKLAVADSGPGVPAEVQTRIFEPFFTTKEVGRGTGMGLAMARGMIEEHGGTLTYAPAPGGGALFEITLSVAQAVSSPGAAALAERSNPARGLMLIVDDEDPIRAMMADILEPIGLVCAEAANGAAALERLAQGAFDLIICDVRMPVMDGITFRRELSARRPELLDRLVFMSGDVLQRERVRYAEISDHAFIEKPFNPKEIRRIAREVLER